MNFNINPPIYDSECGIISSQIKRRLKQDRYDSTEEFWELKKNMFTVEFTQYKARGHSR